MTARTNIHFQEKFFNNPFLSVMNGQKKPLGACNRVLFYRSASRKQPIVQVAPPGEKIFVRSARLSILKRAQNDPIFQRTEASIWSEWLRSRIKTLFGNHGVNHAHGVVEAGQVCDTTGAACPDASPRHFLFTWCRGKVRIFESETERCFPGIRRRTLFRIDRQPGDQVFFSTGSCAAV
jgi:hypothetical protein